MFYKLCALFIGASLGVSVLAYTQGAHPPIIQDTGSGALTGSCGNQTYVDSATGNLYTCSGGAWKQVGAASGGVPSGGIIFVDAGTCPAAFTQDAGFSGAYILGTVAANADVGTTGGSNSYTPAGSNGAPAFTGTAGTVAAQTFTGNSDTTSAVSAGTPAGTNASTTVAATGTKFTTSGSGTAALTAFNGTTIGSGANTLTIPAETFTGSALGTHTHTVTPTGTNSTASFTPAGTVAAPVFTGTGATIQPAFLKVIACKAN